jgi:hypothetical protein
VATTTTSSTPTSLEVVTPRIDSMVRCRCAGTLAWDEVYGWMHTAAEKSRCVAPSPVD